MSGKLLFTTYWVSTNPPTTHGVTASSSSGVNVGAAAPAADAASAYVPTFQPGQHRGPPAGAPNQVLVLGTPHLGEFEGQLRQEQLAPLLARLRQWRPQLIAVERLSGLQCGVDLVGPMNYRPKVTRFATPAQY